MKKNLGLIIFMLVLFSLGLFNGAISLWMDWLWFEETGYPILFTKQIITQWSLTVILGLLFFICVYDKWTDCGRMN